MKTNGYAPPTKGPSTARTINTDHMQFLRNRRVLIPMEKSSDAAQVPFIFSVWFVLFLFSYLHFPQRSARGTAQVEQHYIDCGVSKSVSGKLF
jgi:hypothetical protein